MTKTKMSQYEDICIIDSQIFFESARSQTLLELGNFRFIYCVC